ncbi:hypothetical protein, partial [Archangium sp.]|uniref:hypothetical protein n=1 Tax=Archangium sp. TaxID=1872627 RepID=UPI002D60E7BA
MRASATFAVTLAWSAGKQASQSVTLGFYPLDLAAPGSFCLEAEVPVAVLMLLTTARSCWLCLQVLRPRSPKHVPHPMGARGLLWIDALNQQPSPDAYLAALRATRPQERLADLAFENLKIAWILGEKFRFLTKTGPTVICSFITWALLLIAAVVVSSGSAVSP